MYHHLVLVSSNLHKSIMLPDNSILKRYFVIIRTTRFHWIPYTIFTGYQNNCFRLIYMDSIHKISNLFYLKLSHPHVCVGVRSVGRPWGHLDMTSFGSTCPQVGVMPRRPCKSRYDRELGVCVTYIRSRWIVPDQSHLNCTMTHTSTAGSSPVTNESR